MRGEPRASVCVVGAGIAGLVTAKTLAQDGFDVQVLEKDSELGGTWTSSRAYPGLRTNNTKLSFEFSDFPYPESVDLVPRAEDVRRYLESYADHFDLRSRISFNKEVCDISRTSGDANRLTVTYRSTDGVKDETSRHFDFVAVCNGVFHIPSIPTVPGMDVFGGRILHSTEVRESTYEPGDRVIVVGGGKSAFDCAAWAASEGLSPTLVFRRPHWMVPRFLPGGRIPGDHLWASRLNALFLRYHHSNRIARLMHSVGKPLVRIWWGLLAFAWSKDLKMPRALRPEQPLPAGLDHAGVGGDFYAAVNDGSADERRGSIKRFLPGRVELEDGESLPADIVIFATGWQQSLSFLSEELRNEIAGEGYPRLFRQILPPTVPNIGFIGYASSFSNTLTSEIGAHWLSEHYVGSLRLPTVDALNAMIDRAHEWADSNMPDRGAEGWLGPYFLHYVDELITDMGLETKRARGFVREYLTMYRASRFAGLGDERRRAREALAASRL